LLIQRLSWAIIWKLKFIYMKHLLLVPLIVFIESVLISEELTVANIASDVWCPYTCASDSENKGLLTEVAMSALAEVGIKTNYVSTSWNRAINSVESGKSDLLLGAHDQLGIDVDFFREYFIFDATIFAVRSDSDIEIKQASDLTKHKIGKVGEYGYDETGQWEPFILGHPDAVNVTSIKGEEKLINLLLRERIDLAVLNRDVANYFIQNEGIDSVRIIDPKFAVKLYIGFNKSEKGKLIQEKFVEGLKSLIDKNSLLPIYQKYRIPMPDFQLP